MILMSKRFLGNVGNLIIHAQSLNTRIPGFFAEVVVA